MKVWRARWSLLEKNNSLRRQSNLTLEEMEGSSVIEEPFLFIGRLKSPVFGMMKTASMCLDDVRLC
jgi:hypothetical protein